MGFARGIKDSKASEEILEIGLGAKKVIGVPSRASSEENSFGRSHSKSSLPVRHCPFVCDHLVATKWTEGCGIFAMVKGL